MKPPRRDRPPPPNNERTVAPFPGPWQRWRARMAAFHLREYWWRLLDFFESSRVARVILYFSVIAVAVGAALWLWAYPWWTKRNAIKVAREWLAAGQLRYAAEAAQRAAVVVPESPEPWQIAAELARLGGQKDKALEYSRRAAELAPGDPAVIIGLAAAALRADQTEVADRALSQLPVNELAKSSDAQRLKGELARRAVRLTAAKGYFEAALRIDGSGQAVDEMPLGLILLNATDAGERQRGLGLLTKWTTDREWGATALRTLLADALSRNEKPAMRKWAEALRSHPACTVGDMPTCLLALAKSDETRFAEVLAALEKDHAVTPHAAAQLLGWLNEIGRSADAVRWMRTLPAQAMQRPPLVVLAAEALRASSEWTELRAWTEGKDWGPEVEFLRWAYAAQAARMLGDQARADELSRTLYSHAELNGVHGLFAAATIYSWGRSEEAESLWWRVAEQEGKIAIDALGSLARHYQVQHDADGQYRVFRRLHLLQPQDAAVGNNFAFFAALTKHEERLAEQVARANLALEPHNPVYLATCAFTLFRQNLAPQALELLKPVAAQAPRSPALAFAYGLALAGSGRKAEARTLLQNLDPATLTVREVELIKTTLAD